MVVLFPLRLRLTEIGDTDLMNASYAELSKGVLSLSDTSDDSDISPINPVLPTPTTTPKRTTVDVQKAQVATSFVLKNNAASSLIELQKQHLKLEVFQLVEKQHDELEDKLFKMKEELLRLEVRLLGTSNNESQLLSFQQKQSFLKMKINKGNKKIKELEIEINK